MENFFAVYKILFIVAMVLIATISVFVVIGIKRAQEENKEITKIQKEQLETLQEMLGIMKELYGQKTEVGSKSQETETPKPEAGA